MKLNNLSLGLATSGFGTAILASAFTMPALSHFRFGAGLFPGIIGSCLVLVGILIAASRQDRAEPLFTPPEWIRHREGLRGLVLLLGLLAAFYAFAESVGFIPMVIVVILTLLLHKGVRLIPAVVIAVVMSVGIEQFFGELLDVPLPWGILENYSSVLSWK